MNMELLAVLMLGAMTLLVKASGLMLFGGRELPASLRAALPLLAPALLAAMVVNGVLATSDGPRVDARLLGLIAALLGLYLRLPLLAVMALAAGATAAGRLLLG